MEHRIDPDLVRHHQWLREWGVTEDDALAIEVPLRIDEGVANPEHVALALAIGRNTGSETGMHEGIAILFIRQWKTMQSPRPAAGNQHLAQ